MGILPFAGRIVHGIIPVGIPSGRPEVSHFRFDLWPIFFMRRATRALFRHLNIRVENFLLGDLGSPVVRHVRFAR